MIAISGKEHAEARASLIELAELLVDRLDMIKDESGPGIEAGTIIKIGGVEFVADFIVHRKL